MDPMTHGRRIGVTAALLAAALICVGIASATHSVIPVFVVWIPLLALPWVLTRPVVGDPAGPGSRVGVEADDTRESAESDGVAPSSDQAEPDASQTD